MLNGLARGQEDGQHSVVDPAISLCQSGLSSPGVCRTFSQLARPHARRTERLENLLTRIGVLLGGEAGARLSQNPHAPISPDTILRLLYRMELTPAASLRLVCIYERT